MHSEATAMLMQNNIAKVPWKIFNTTCVIKFAVTGIVQVFEITTLEGIEEITKHFFSNS